MMMQDIERQDESAGDTNRPKLDALLSPHTSSSSELELITPVSVVPDHGSVMTDLSIDADDDTDGRFSTISLGAASTSGLKSPSSRTTNTLPTSDDDQYNIITHDDDDAVDDADADADVDVRRQTISLINSSSTYPPLSKKTLHRKSRSTSSGPGPGPVKSDSNGKKDNLPFLLHQLHVQKVKDESVTESRRVSVDGQIKLQEGFDKLQSEKKEKASAGDAALNGHSNIDWDFWGAVMADYQQFASDNPEPLAKAIERGIPSSLRGMMWQLMAASKDPELESTYLRLLKETSPHEKAILRDLGRTFPHHEFFTDGQGIGQENLFNVLKAYSLHDPQVGYCQGLPFVVAVLLLNMPDEEAFCLLVRLMQSYDLRGHFLPEMPGLQLRLFQFDRLLEELLPVLHVHFLRQGIKSSMFCSQWFLTMFSYRFPLEVVFRIYDNVLATGIEAIFAFSIMLLQKNEEALLALKFDEILAFLKNRLFEKYIISQSEESSDIAETSKSISMDNLNLSSSNLSFSQSSKILVDEFVQDAVIVKITPFMLDAYAHEYEDLVKTRDAHAIEMDALRNANRQLAAQVKYLETSLAQVNEEQVEVLKELVMMRLKSEEMESELVRYKLLYADVMHQNADAMSSHRLSTPMKHTRVNGLSRS